MFHVKRRCILEVRAKKNPAQWPGCNPAMCAGPTRDVNRGAVTLKADYERRTRKRLGAQNSPKTYTPPGLSKKRLKSAIYPLLGPFDYHPSPLWVTWREGEPLRRQRGGLPSTGAGAWPHVWEAASRRRRVARGGAAQRASMLPPRGPVQHNTSSRLLVRWHARTFFIVFIVFRGA